MKICTKSLNDTKKLAEIFASNLDKDGAFVCLYGDLGAGKTAFVRCILQECGIKESVTSPSFVILNEYKININNLKLPVYHFDLYRLETTGVKTISDELREYSKKGVLTFVEWADFGADEIPYDRLNIKVSYSKNSDDIRFFEFIPKGERHKEFAMKIISDWKKNNEHSLF